MDVQVPARVAVGAVVELVWLEDLVDGPGGPVNVGNPGEFTIKELAMKVLEKIPSSPSRIVQKPLPADDPKKRRPDITLAKEFLGWEPTTALDAGLDKTVEYFKSKTEYLPNKILKEQI